MRCYVMEPEAIKIREQRRASRRSQSYDTLAERQRLIAFWKKCSISNKHYIPYNGAWWHPFLCQKGFRELLMPKLRARFDECDRLREQQRRDALHRESVAYQQAKAEKKAAKLRAKQPQSQLFQ